VRTRWIIASVLAVVGAVWVGQGLGLLGGSTMTGDVRWALGGAALVAGAVVVGWTALRRRPRT